MEDLVILIEQGLTLGATFGGIGLIGFCIYSALPKGGDIDRTSWDDYNPKNNLKNEQYKNVSKFD